MSAQHPIEVGIHRVYFRLTRTHGKNQLEPMTQQWSGDDVSKWYRTHRWPEGAQYEIVLKVYVADGRLFVGSIQVVTVPEAYEGPSGMVMPPKVGPISVGVDIWRLLKPGALAQAAIEEVQDFDTARMALAEDQEAFDRLAEAAARGERGKLRRGPRSPYTPELLEVAAQAYLRGGRTGRVAARQALQDAGLPGNGPDGEVTPDQAQKAVRKARLAGLLPKVRSSATRQQQIGANDVDYDN